MTTHDTHTQPAYVVVASDLAEAGVSVVCGLMGDDTAKLVTALGPAGIDYRGARHENSAVAMAEGYAWATGTLGVCILSRGPGLTNGLTGIVNAARGGESVLVIIGAPATGSGASIWGPDEKAFDAAALGAVSGVSVHMPMRAENVRSTLAEAIAEAGSGSTVIFSIPMDLLAGQLDAAAAPERPTTTPPAPMPRTASIEAAAMAIARASRPLILAGRGAIGARKELEELAERTGGVLGTTLRAKDLFAGHPYAVGIVGSFSHSAGRSVVDQADLVLAVGAGLNAYTTNRGEALPEGTVIHVDVDASHVGRYHPADLGIVGEARTVTQLLLDLVPDRDQADKPLHVEAVRKRLSSARPSDEYQDASTAKTIDPRVLLTELNELLPAERTIVTDVGNFFGFVPQHLTSSPDRFKLSSNFSAIGLGFGTALGAALGRPDTATVLIEGDGSLLMTLGELETVVREFIPLVLVCMNDHSYGAEKHYLELTGSSGKLANFPDADFAALAMELGIEAHTIRSVADLHAIRDVLSSVDGPLLLDCKVVPAIVAPFLAEVLAE